MSDLRAELAALADEWEHPSEVYALRKSAAPRLRALLEAHSPSEGVEQVQWGVRHEIRPAWWQGGDVVTTTTTPGGVVRKYDEALARSSSKGRAVRRTVTTYPDRVTEWEEVDD